MRPKRARGRRAPSAACRPACLPAVEWPRLPVWALRAPEAARSPPAPEAAREPRARGRGEAPRAGVGRVGDVGGPYVARVLTPRLRRREAQGEPGTGREGRHEGRRPPEGPPPRRAPEKRRATGDGSRRYSRRKGGSDYYYVAGDPSSWRKSYLSD